MYRIWEDDAAIEVAGARIGSALSSQASQGQWPGSSQAETRANCHQAGWAQVVLGSSQPGPESPVISQHFQVFRPCNKLRW